MSMIKELTGTSAGELYSPFVYRDYEYKVANDKQSVSHNEIKRWIEKRELQEYHTQIIRLFSHYRYLTTHLIEMSLGNNYFVDGEGKRVTVKAAISLLVERGILLRFFLEQKEPLKLPGTPEFELEDSEEGAYPDRKRSVNLYALSKGGLSFAIKEGICKAAKGTVIDDKTKIIEEVPLILKKIALNLFLIRVKKGLKMGHTVSIQAAADLVSYRPEEMTTAVIENKNTQGELERYFAIAVRKTEGWKEEAVRMAREWVNGSHAADLPVVLHIVFLCESRWQSFELFQYMRDSKDKPISARCFFTSDPKVNKEEECYFSEFYIKGGVVYQGELPEPFLSK